MKGRAAAADGGGADAPPPPKHPSYVPPDVPRRIKRIRFGVMSAGEIVKTSELQVYERQLYNIPDRKPAANGVLDPRLGVSSKAAACGTCGLTLAECAGHFGYIRLALPVFHVGYFKATLQALQCICKTCSRALLPPDERERALRALRAPRAERAARAAALKRAAERCRRVRACSACGAANGPVKKVPGSLKIVHDVYGGKHAAAAAAAYRAEFADALAANDALEAGLRRLADDLHPLRARALLAAVPPADAELLALACAPVDLIVTHLPVPPVCIRPSVEVDVGAGTNEDDITMKLMMIIDVNNIVRKALADGASVPSLAEHWDFLQVQAALYINSELPGLPSAYQAGSKPLRGFVQRLKGKQGRFRGNLSGKRVDFSARTVISPDPNLAPGEVGVPRCVATTLTYPERVTPHNVGALRARVLNGMAVWPGANFVAFPDGGRWFLKYGDRARIAAELAPGDVVERHLADGDVVLFNRQPSLHRLSIMAHRVRVVPGRTFRFNECVCAPYNADFDGDEMNVHVPQTEEARAEARELMAVDANLRTPKNGDLVVAATQDFLTVSWLLTSRDAWLTRAQLGQWAAAATAAAARVDIPPPAIVKPVELWSGKQLFSLLVRPAAVGDDGKPAPTVCLHTAEKGHVAAAGPACPNDGYVLFVDSDLLLGRLGKATLGAGGARGLFAALAADAGAPAAAAAMHRLARLAARWVGDAGLSIGVDDVTPAAGLDTAKRAALAHAHARADALAAAAADGTLPRAPGCDAAASLEAALTGLLNGVREHVSRLCVAGLHRHNTPLLMAQCGAKGSPINIAQMVACVGQQSVGGRRPPDGFRGRALPAFKRGDVGPAARGFVASSFFEGLQPAEFFFHAMAGREGLVDTAVKTAETDYMSRRLMKALEDQYVAYDGTVRNAGGAAVALTYGDDGLDPASMDGAGAAPVDVDRLLASVVAARRRAERSAVAEGGEAAPAKAPLPSDLAAAGAAALARWIDDTGGGDARGGGAAVGARVAVSPAFGAALRASLDAIVAEAAAARKRVGLPPDARGSAAAEAAAAAVTAAGVQPADVAALVKAAAARYDVARVQPGATVGAVGAQSIGEPGTQMTLKTFHFAGVASMNVTLGVPRVKEIINAARAISTPIIQVALDDASEAGGRAVRDALQRTTLAEAALSIEAVLAAGGAHVRIVLRPQTDEGGRPADAVVAALLAAPKLRLKPDHVKRVAPRDGVHAEIWVYPPDDADAPKPRGGTAAAAAAAAADADAAPAPRPAKHAAPGTLFALHALLRALPGAVVGGVPSVERAVLTRGDDPGTVKLTVEGTDLAAVMGTPGVDGAATVTNHVMEVERVLGIEAARAAIAAEVASTMGAHGMAVDARHNMLLADCMTYKGEALGITRFGIAKMKDSVLMLASFEKTTDHLFDAALRGAADDVRGVSESIIVGAPMAPGTGLFRLRAGGASVEIGAPPPPPVLAAWPPAAECV